MSMNGIGVSAAESNGNTNNYGANEKSKVLRDLGIFTPETLAASVKKDAKTPFLIEGF